MSNQTSQSCVVSSDCPGRCFGSTVSLYVDQSYADTVYKAKANHLKTVT